MGWGRTGQGGRGAGGQGGQRTDVFTPKRKNKAELNLNRNKSTVACYCTVLSYILYCGYCTVLYRYEIVGVSDSLDSLLVN
jgi:hypothetical protein